MFSNFWTLLLTSFVFYDIIIYYGPDDDGPDDNPTGPPCVPEPLFNDKIGDMCGYAKKYLVYYTTELKLGVIHDKPAQYSAISTGPSVNMFLFIKMT